MGAVQQIEEIAETVIDLTLPQSAFWESKFQYPLFVGGFGSGKSKVASLKTIDDIMAFPGANIGCYAPSYDLLNLITQAYLEEHLEMMDQPYKVNGQKHTIDVEGYGKIIMRSMSNPERIIGYQVLRSHVDEIDTLKKKRC